jgi:hypothetical protein
MMSIFSLLGYGPEWVCGWAVGSTGNNCRAALNPPAQSLHCVGAAGPYSNERSPEPGNEGARRKPRLQCLTVWTLKDARRIPGLSLPCPAASIPR